MVKKLVSKFQRDSHYFVFNVPVSMHFSDQMDVSRWSVHVSLCRARLLCLFCLADLNARHWEQVGEGKPHVLWSSQGM